MPARLILIGFCLLISACATPWQRDDGRTGAPNAESGLRRLGPPLRPIDGASLSSRRVAHLEADVTDRLAGPRTVEELLQYATEHHPILRVRKHEIEVAEGRLIGARVRPNPQIVIDVDHRNDDGSTQASARVEKLWETADKRRRRKDVAAAAVARAKLALNREAKAVLSRAAQAAVDVLYYKQLVQLYERVGRLADKADAWQKSRVESGDVSALDGFVLRADAAEIKQERFAALRQLKAAQITLAQAIGARGPRPIEVEGRLIEAWLPDIPLEAVLDELRFAGPETAEQRAAIRQSEQQEALEKANAIPNIEYGPRFSETFSDAAGSVGFRLRGEVPFSDRNQGGILTSAARTAREEAMLDAVRLETLGDAAIAYAELAPLRSQLEHYTTKIKPMLDQTEQSLNEAIDQRLIDPGSLNAHIRRLVRLRLDHLRGRYRYAQLHMWLVAASSRAIKERQRAADPK